MSIQVKFWHCSIEVRKIEVELKCRGQLGMAYMKVLMVHDQISYVLRWSWRVVP